MNGTRPPIRRNARWHNRLLGCLLLSFFAASTDFAADSAPKKPVTELQVKAALVFRVAKFINWPAQAFGSASDPFVTCVASHTDAASRAFDDLQGKLLGGRTLVVRRVTGDMLDLRQCHAVFFPADSGSDVDYALGKLEGTPVLTIGEDEAFIKRGGMLALVTRDQRVRFSINLGVTKHAGLEVSSQLLQLATVVGSTSP